MKEKVYYPELDGLRFLAFFAVFIHHGPALTWLPGYAQVWAYGWIGVDLFLCLSAFLFVHLLRMEWTRTGTINVWFFYLRRSLRIWPIYIIFVALIVLISFSRNEISNLNLLRLYGLFTFTDNLLTAYISYNTLMYLSHLWTISYEEQFYAFVPWFLRYMFPQTMRKQIFTLGMIFIVGFAFRAVFIALNVPHPAIWVLPITHFESILFGLAIGLGMFDLALKRVPALLTAMVGIFGLYLCTLQPNVWFIGWPLMWLYPLVGISVALLVHSTLRARQSIIAAALSWKPVAFLGRISYGLYLFHFATLALTKGWVELNFAGKSIEKQSYLIFGAALVLTIVVASLSYLLIEKPFLKMKSRFTIVESRPI